MLAYIISKLENNIAKILVFAINIVLFLFGVMVIKDRDDSKIAMQTETAENFAPINGQVLQNQEKIATDRENKMRDLNSAPKEIKQNQTTTKKTTTTPPPSSSSSSSSSKSSSSKKTTKTS